MQENISLKLTERELTTAISALLFSCSVNVVSNCSEEFQFELYNLAKKLKSLNPNIELSEIQFLKETNYEDKISQDLLFEFEKNFKQVVTFEQV